MGQISVNEAEIKLIGQLKRKAHKCVRREPFISQIGILYVRFCQQLQRNWVFPADLIRYRNLSCYYTGKKERQFLCSDSGCHSGCDPSRDSALVFNKLFIFIEIGITWCLLGAFPFTWCRFGSNIVPAQCLLGAFSAKLNSSLSARQATELLNNPHMDSDRQPRSKGEFLSCPKLSADYSQVYLRLLHMQIGSRARNLCPWSWRHINAIPSRGMRAAPNRS